MLTDFVIDGIITTQDLANYTAKIKTPLNITVRRKNGNFMLFSPPPPLSGAIDLFILNILKGRHVFLVTDASSKHLGNIQRYTPITVYETAPFQTRNI